MFAQAARGPVLLILVGTLFALQQAGVIPVSRTWPLLIIVVGVMKLFERVPVGGTPMYPPRPPVEPPGGTRL
jgi:cell wall-active antibiotic response 4TMS protein YvqF